jgi:hypothetical protein
MADTKYSYIVQLFYNERESWQPTPFTIDANSYEEMLRKLGEQIDTDFKDVDEFGINHIERIIRRDKRDDVPDECHNLEIIVYPKRKFPPRPRGLLADHIPESIIDAGCYLLEIS